MVDVSIILVNYKTAEMTVETVNSITKNSKGFSYEIIIVDNSEDINESEYLKKEAKGSSVIIPPDNLGFGNANNLGASAAKGEYLFFLNTDTLLINNAIGILEMFLASHSDVGVAGGNLYTNDREPNHSYVFHEKNINYVIKQNSFQNFLKKRLKKKRDDFNYSNDPIRIHGYICGADLMIRRELFESIGGFDKDIFMYGEEALLCYRVLHETNYSIYNVPAAKIIHFEGESVKKEPTLKASKIKIDGEFQYFKKAYGYETAIEFLSVLRKIYANKRRAAILLRKHRKVTYYSNQIQTINSKKKELSIIH